MTHDQLEQPSQQSSPTAGGYQVDALLPRLRAYFSTQPEIRLAYFQPGPKDEALNLTGPDQDRVIIAFTRNVTSEHIDKRLLKVRKHFAAVVHDAVDFLDIERIGYREACEVAFNAQSVYGSVEMIERDRLYRYNVFLEWNAGKKLSGTKQDQPPALVPSVERPQWVVSVPRFITPIYRHLKMIEGHAREIRRLLKLELNDFSADSTHKSLAESYMLKGIQSAILITMSVMHRKMRLTARDYRDLFLLMPMYGIANRERAYKLARCADIRDRLMFQYEEVTAPEVYQNADEVAEILQDFKTFMLEWLFENYYAPTGELIQSE